MAGPLLSSMRLRNRDMSTVLVLFVTGVFANPCCCRSSLSSELVSASKFAAEVAFRLIFHFSPRGSVSQDGGRQEDTEKCLR